MMVRGTGVSPVFNYEITGETPVPRYKHLQLAIIMVKPNFWIARSSHDARETFWTSECFFVTQLATNFTNLARIKYRLLHIAI